jgi:ABC-type molybdate transport system ATPase subunit
MLDFFTKISDDTKKRVLYVEHCINSLSKTAENVKILWIFGVEEVYKKA